MANSMGTGASVLLGAVLSPMTRLVFFQIFAGIFMGRRVGGMMHFMPGSRKSQWERVHSCVLVMTVCSGAG